MCGGFLPELSADRRQLDATVETGPGGFRLFAIRSTPEFGKVTSGMLAQQVDTLVSSLHLALPAFFWLQLQGLAVLTLVAQHPALVPNALVHQAALVNDSVPPEALADSVRAQRPR